MLAAGESTGDWTVDLPAEEVPSELPEPCLGINFARYSNAAPDPANACIRNMYAQPYSAVCRDGMEQKDWLRLVAAHSDAWLVSVAFYYGAKLRPHER